MILISQHSSLKLRSQRFTFGCGSQGCFRGVVVVDRLETFLERVLQGDSRVEDAIEVVHVEDVVHAGGGHAAAAQDQQEDGNVASCKMLLLLYMQCQ